jgi:starvation-inducible DNA-binding protein
MSTAMMERKTPQSKTQDLETLMADTYLLYTKTQNFHWNVVDPRFHSLHTFFEEQYKELAEAIDVIAEQIRSQGHKAPGSMREFLQLSNLQEASGNLPANTMLQTLLKDHEAIIQWLRPAIDHFAKIGDQAASDLCIDRLRVHEKALWMIKSHFNPSEEGEKTGKR